MKSRTETWLALIVLAVGLLLAAILRLFAYMSATANALHPNPQDVPSVTRSAPLPQWADAVEQGRRIVRAGLTEQNLPGISVLVRPSALPPVHQRSQCPTMRGSMLASICA
jgi:hypothetical protein